LALPLAISKFTLSYVGTGIYCRKLTKFGLQQFANIKSNFPKIT